jgi:hypothetical protein
MHTLQLKIDDSIFEKFMGLLDILPKDKVSISESFENDAISFENAKIKVQNAINNISKNDAVALDEAFHKALNS